MYLSTPDHCCVYYTEPGLSMIIHMYVHALANGFNFNSMGIRIGKGQLCVPYSVVILQLVISCMHTYVYTYSQFPIMHGMGQVSYDMYELASKFAPLRTGRAGTN